MIDHRRLYQRRRRRTRHVAPERPGHAPPVEYGGRHPFEAVASKKRGRRQMGKDNNLSFQPIRIIYDTSILEDLLRVSINRESDIKAARAFLLLYEILPKTAARLAQIISVIPVQGALFPLSLREEEAGNKESFCPHDKTGGISGGGDLLIYVTLDRYFCNGGNNADDKNSFSTAASALSCERDQFDRPVTGTIDFCLDSMGTVTKIADLEGIVESIKNNSTTTTSSLAIGKSNGVVVERMIEIATHELLHVLGLTSDSLPFFRNPVTGKPLTPRPFRVTETTCSNGETKAVLGEPSALVVGRVVDTITGLSHFEVRTPLVTQVVRNHFNCPSLTGARLENNPTSTDCFGSHWEERLHYSELMSAYLSTAYNYAVSPLTLAFLEDTSWYRANYQSEYVQSSAFGHLAGCDFVNEPCIVNGEVPNYGIGNFCSNTLETTEQGFVVRQAFPQTCDPTYKYKAHCDLRNARAGDVISEISRRYFPDGRVKIPNEFTHAAFCPIPSLQPTSCQNPEDQFIVSREYADAGEKNGPNSICVDVNRDRAICLQSFCNPGISRLQIQVLYGLNVTCMFDGQIHTLLGSSGSPNGLPFQITCPKLSQVCPDIICPDNCSGRGQCNYDEETGTGHCKCFDSNDNTTGCYTSSLKSVFSELSVSSVNGLSNEANLGMFLFVVSGVVLGLVGLHIWQRFRTDHFRREEKEEASAQKTDLFRDEEVESPRGSVESFHRYREKFNPIGDSGLEGSY